MKRKETISALVRQINGNAWTILKVLAFLLVASKVWWDFDFMKTQLAMTAEQSKANHEQLIKLNTTMDEKVLAASRDHARYDECCRRMAECCGGREN